MRNEETHSLANISLRWMVREAINAKCGIMFDPDALVRANLKLDPLPSTEEIAEDDLDAVTDIHDELVLQKLWWILEIIPLHFSWQDDECEWHTDWK